MAISKARREEIESHKTFTLYRQKIADITKAEDTQTHCFAREDEYPIEELPF